MDYILAIDQSTAGTKGIVCTANGEIVSRYDLPHKQIVNEKHWIEHDPVEILNNTLEVCRRAINKAGIVPGDVRAVGISNQRETVVCWNRETGKPVYNAIVWQCGRAKDIAARLKDNGDAIRDITGLQLSPFFSAAKFAWILENVPEAKKLAEEGKLCCGNIDAWLIYNLTVEHAFKTDFSNASRTQLLNLDKLQWDDSVAEMFGIPVSTLPEICDSDSVFGHTNLNGFLPECVPICAVLGDSHGALYANGCHTPNTAKATFGTGTSVMMNTGESRVRAKTDGVVESLAWRIDGKTNYVLEGNINYSGAIIKWLVDNVGLIASSKESGIVAQEVNDNGGVYLVPAFSGLGAPYWKNDVRAIICGINAGTKKAHIVRAAEEAIAYQIKDIFTELNESSSDNVKELCVDGGATKDKFLMNFVAGILDTNIKVSSVEELSAAGVAYLASIKSGCSDKKTIFSKVRHTVITPDMSENLRAELYSGWKNAVGILLK